MSLTCPMRSHPFFHELPSPSRLRGVGDGFGRGGPGLFLTQLTLADVPQDPSRRLITPDHPPIGQDMLAFIQRLLRKRRGDGTLRRGVPL
jgi:hypothetical protein